MTRTFLTAYAATAAAFLAADSVWLTAMAPRLYRPLLGDRLAESFEPVSAALFYLLYVAGTVVFAVLPSEGRARTAALRGAFLGLCAYGTYDLTNLATLRDWPVLLSAVDLLWGTVLTGAAATAGTLAVRRFAGPRPGDLRPGGSARSRRG